MVVELLGPYNPLFENLFFPLFVMVYPDSFECLLFNAFLLHGFSPDGHASLELNRVASEHHVENVFHRIFPHVSFVLLNIKLIDQLPECEKLEAVIVEVCC